VSVRQARPEDAAVILDLVRELAAYERALEEVEATRQDLLDTLFAPNPAVFAHVAEQDGEVVGVAIWFLNYSTWLGKHGMYLEDLYVRPEARGQGHGRALLQTLAGICVERGYRRLQWWVLDWNEPALGFYRSIGAVPMHEWTVQRVTGDALRRLAGGDPG
jgi:GNAT superfamily N-acetyltransferase